jgi:hypothetical protein
MADGLVARFAYILHKERHSLERATAGEFEGGGVAPLRGSAERSEAPKGELDSPLEVPRLCEILEQETYETGH